MWDGCVLCGFPADEQLSQYSKLLLASKEQVLHRVVLEEKGALEQQLAEEKHTPESCFIEAAIQEVKVNRWELQTSFPELQGGAERPVRWEWEGGHVVESFKLSGAKPQPRMVVLTHCNSGVSG